MISPIKEKERAVQEKKRKSLFLEERGGECEGDHA